MARARSRETGIGKRDKDGEEVRVGGGGGKMESRELAECSTGALFPWHKGTSVRRHGDKPEELERQPRAAVCLRHVADRCVRARAVPLSLLINYVISDVSPFRLCVHAPTDDKTRAGKRGPNAKYTDESR